MGGVGIGQGAACYIPGRLEGEASSSAGYMARDRVGIAGNAQHATTTLRRVMRP